MKKLIFILLIQTVTICNLFGQTTQNIRNNPLLPTDSILLIDSAKINAIKGALSLPLMLKISSQLDENYFEIVTATSLLSNLGKYSRIKITRSKYPKWFPENDSVVALPPSKIMTSDSTVKTAQLPTAATMKTYLAIANTDVAGLAALATKNQASLTADVSGVLPVANGGSMTGTAAMSATTGTITVPMTSAIYTVTPTGAITANLTAGTVSGTFVTFVITTSGATSFNFTPNTNAKSAVLATGTTTAKTFKITFRWDGTLWQEICRTAAQ